MDTTHGEAVCGGGGPQPVEPPPPQPAGERDAEPRAECVLCREPTEYQQSAKGATLCPVCEWQEAQRSACSG